MQALPACVHACAAVLHTCQCSCVQHAVCCEKCAAPVATGDEVDPRVSCSEGEEQRQLLPLLLQRQQRVAVGSCGRRDAASQLRSPLRLWFSASRCFSRKRRDFCHDGAHFFTSRTMNPMFVFHLWVQFRFSCVPVCLQSGALPSSCRA